jgi:hypothetical protein
MDMFIAQKDDDNNRVSKYYSKIGLEGLVVVQSIWMCMIKVLNKRSLRSVRY